MGWRKMNTVRSTTGSLWELIRSMACLILSLFCKLLPGRQEDNWWVRQDGVVKGKWVLGTRGFGLWQESGKNEEEQRVKYYCYYYYYWCPLQMPQTVIWIHSHRLKQHLQFQKIQVQIQERQNFFIIAIMVTVTDRSCIGLTTIEHLTNIIKLMAVVYHTKK